MKRIITIGLAVALAFAVAGCTAAESTVATSSSLSEVDSTPIVEATASVSPEPEAEPAPAWESLDELLASHEWTAEEGTSGRVDEIILAASADATTVNDDILIEAQNYIVESYPDFFVDAETMEKLMYCGRLLEKACSRDKARRNNATLGMNTVQAIKYVYRGAEAVDDEATQMNMEEVRGILELFGLIG